MMDYLEQIRIFNQLLPNSGLNASGVCLWYGLMYIFSINGWKQELRIPMNEIVSHTTLSRFTIARSREQLRELGLIRYSHQSGACHVTYEILPLSEEILRKMESGMLRPATSRLQKSPTMLQNDTALSQIDTSLLQKATKRENAYIEDNNNTISKDYKERIKENQKRKKKATEPAKPPKEKRQKVSLEPWLATLQEPWLGLIRQWLDYKVARKETYKTEVGARKCLTMLQNLSGGNAQIAQLIIDQSIACNYAGLFALKQQNTNRTQAPQTGQRIGQIKQPETEEKRQRLLERFAQTEVKKDNNE